MYGFGGPGADQGLEWFKGGCSLTHASMTLTVRETHRSTRTGIGAATGHGNSETNHGVLSSTPLNSNAYLRPGSAATHDMMASYLGCCRATGEVSSHDDPRAGQANADL